MKRFFMVDGLDGSGKGTVVDGFKEWAEAEGKSVLDARAYCKEHDRFPTALEVAAAEVIISSEPSYCYVGKAIREELIRRSERSYSGWTLAQAFSLDREMLYQNVILPAIKAGKIVVQERGIVSSLVYQPVQERIQLSELMRLPGNKMAMQNAPSVLIIAKVSPETVIKRLGVREKKDDSIFDNLSFQRTIEARYSSEWLKQLFEKFGSKVEYLDTDEPKTPEDTKKDAIELLKRFL